MRVGAPAAVAATAIVLIAANVAAAGTVRSGFQETVVFSGLTYPTAVRFAPDGRVFVAEKTGVVKVYPSIGSSTPAVFADLRAEVDDYWDRGLLGLALDPAFPARPYVYVLYTYDAPIGGTAPAWDDECPSPPGPTGDGCVVSGRLARLTASGDVSVAQQVLIEGWCQQYPSHSIGDLRFGADGALYVSGGDGASFTFTDLGQGGGSAGSPTPRNPCGDPPVPVGGSQLAPTAEGGALRSQSLRRRPGEPVVLNGSILRVDPDTGAAMVDNPLAGSLDQNARRIVAYGMRNPFRFAVRPGTDELWVGDVGASSWEEIDRIGSGADAVVENFGWPCFEGPGADVAYQSPNLDICGGLAQPGTVTAPYYTYSHGSHVVADEACSVGSSSISGIAFYTGSLFPTQYRGALLFGDHSRRCIWAMPVGAGGRPDPSKLEVFDADAANPVDIESGPSGDLFYVDHEGGTVRRISYLGTNRPPDAKAITLRASGAAPLTTAFDGSGSRDPDAGDTISYSWDLNGDGMFGDSTAVRPTFTYAKPGTYTVKLRVSDNRGASSDSAPITISANNTPPAPRIVQPGASLTWKVGDVISFGGTATDVQDGTLAPARLAWSLIVHHCPSNCHTHTIQSWDGTANGSFVAPDHDYPSYLELQLRATDSTGATSTTSVSLQPKTASLAFASVPQGLQIVVGTEAGTTPFSRTVIVGSTNTVGAITPQSLGGLAYAYDSWSDGGARTRDVVAGFVGASYVASFVPASAPGPDTRPPAVAVTAPSAGTAVRGTIPIGASATDDVAVAGVRFQLDGSALGAEDTTAPYSVQWPTAAAANGPHTLTAIARDAAGNSATSAGAGVTVDNEAPAVDVTAPAAGAVVAGPTTLAATATDNVNVAGVQLRIDGVAVGAEDTAPPYSLAWDSSSLANGAHSVTAVARDGAGNTTTSGAVAITTSNTASPTPGLVAAYGFDEGSGMTVGDASGRGNTGTATNTAWTTDGRFGGALAFDGTSSWVTVPHVAALDLAMGMTLEAWVKPSSLGSGWRTILFKEQAGQTVYGLYANDGAFPVAQVWVGSRQTGPGSTPIPLSTWTHLAATFDGQILRLYVNGAVAATRTIRGGISPSTGPLRIGGTAVWPAWFAGTIDEVRIYSRALSASAVAADMARPVR